MSSIGEEVDALVNHLKTKWTARFAERSNQAGDTTITVAPPDLDDLGYDVPCPPGLRTYSGAVLIVAPTADAGGARELLDDLQALAADCHDAGWKPARAQAVDVDDRPGYLIALTREA